VVAFAIPLLVLRPSASSRPFALPGLGVLVVGSVVLAWCVRDFLLRGQGTLAPWDPPATLVRTGLYRYSRNPMYIGVLLILLGWALGFRSRALAVYTAVFGIVFHLRVVFWEEPWLARTHGAAWAEYRAHVPRWLL